MPVADAIRKPPKNSTPDNITYILGDTFFAKIPAKRQPIQKKAMTMVKVIDNCAALQSGREAAIDFDITDHA